MEDSQVKNFSFKRDLFQVLYVNIKRPTRGARKLLHGHYASQERRAVAYLVAGRRSMTFVKARSHRCKPRPAKEIERFVSKPFLYFGTRAKNGVVSEWLATGSPNSGYRSILASPALFSSSPSPRGVLIIKAQTSDTT